MLNSELLPMLEDRLPQPGPQGGHVTTRLATAALALLLLLTTMSDPRHRWRFVPDTWVTLFAILAEGVMPWKERSVMEERLRFVARLIEGEAMTDLCGFVRNFV